MQRTYDPDGSATAQSATNEYFVYGGDELSMRFGNAQELTHRYLCGPLTDQVLVDEFFTASGSQRFPILEADNSATPIDIRS